MKTSRSTAKRTTVVRRLQHCHDTISDASVFILGIILDHPYSTLAFFICSYTGFFFAFFFLSSSLPTCHNMWLGLDCFRFSPFFFSAFSLSLFRLFSFLFFSVRLFLFSGRCCWNALRTIKMHLDGEDVLDLGRSQSSPRKRKNKQKKNAKKNCSKEKKSIPPLPLSTIGRPRYKPEAKGIRAMRERRSVCCSCNSYFRIPTRTRTHICRYQATGGYLLCSIFFLFCDGCFCLVWRWRGRAFQKGGDILFFLSFSFSFSFLFSFFFVIHPLHSLGRVAIL